jgi:uncharacterized BrkB/YihY/UPF0761 family membrane protein
MRNQPIMINSRPFVIFWLVLIVLFLFLVKVPAWRAIAYGTTIIVVLFLIVFVAVNWYAAKH